MADGSTPNREVVLETDRLLLRPWRVAEAAAQRELWIERDPRVPPRRRIDADGHPTVADLQESIRTNLPSSSIGCWRSSGRPLVTSSATAGSSTADEDRTGSRSWRSNCCVGRGVRDTRPRPRWRFWTGRDRPGTDACGPRCGIGTPLLAECWPSSDSQRPTGRKLTPCVGSPSSPYDGSEIDESSEPLHQTTVGSRLSPRIGLTRPECVDAADDGAAAAEGAAAQDAGQFGQVVFLKQAGVGRH